MKYYILYLLLMILIYGILVSCFSGIKVTEFDISMPNTPQIIINNLKNYLMWTVCFIIWPVNFLFETTVLSFSIKTGIVNLGFIGTLAKLWKHGVIEFPNMCLYQLLSLRLLYFWWKDKKISTVYHYMLANKKIYCYSGILIVIAGLIEGML